MQMIRRANLQSEKNNEQRSQPWDKKPSWLILSDFKANKDNAMRSDEGQTTFGLFQSFFLRRKIMSLIKVFEERSEKNTTTDDS